MRKPAGNRCSNDERTDAGFLRPSNDVIGALLGDFGPGRAMTMRVDQRGDMQGLRGEPLGVATR